MATAMKKVLVTGGLGFIGSHTAVELLGRGYEAVIADNLSNTRAAVLDGIEAIAGVRPSWVDVDLADPTACRAFLARHGDLAGIIHFAAHKAVGESVQKPLQYYLNNLGSLALLLEHVAAHPACGFIFSSSCTVYGQADELPIREDAPIKPAESPYGNTKQVGEEVLREAGTTLYNWAEFETGKIESLRIRARVTEPYVLRGSFHILADSTPEPKVYWHPRFLDRLGSVLGIAS